MYIIWYILIVCFINFQDTRTPQDVATDKSQSEPYLIVLNSQVFLVVDNDIVFELQPEDSALGLLSSFFIFNICYTKGCSSFFNALEFLSMCVKLKVYHHSFLPSTPNHSVM